MSKSSQWLTIAWRLFRHETRRGELTIITLAIALSVAAVLSLSLFGERIQVALHEKVTESFTADNELWSDKPIEQAWLDKAHQLELKTAKRIGLQSMLFAGDNMTLTQVVAVTPEFPLKGANLVADEAFADGYESTDTPAEGEIWVASRVLQLLDIQLGQQVEIGDKSLTVSKILVESADKTGGFFSTTPVVMTHFNDIWGTDLTGPYSRVGYAAYFIGEEDAREEYESWLLPQLNSDIHHWSSVDGEDSWLGNTVSRATSYFLLASLLAIILAAVSIAVAAQRYATRHYDPVAIMKTLGASQSDVRKIFLVQMMLVAFTGIVIGSVAGYVIQSVVAEVISERIDVALNTWYWRPFLIAIATGFICALLFSVYPLLKLFGVPPLRVLRRDLVERPVSMIINLLFAGIAIFLLMWLYSGDLKISAILFISGIVLVGVLVLVTLGLIRLGRKFSSGNLHQSASGAWSLAWARIQRRAMGNAVQLISFALTILLLLIVLVLRNDMLNQWRDQLPQGTPNYFLANITSSELEELKGHFAASDIYPEHFYPIVRGRLTSVNEDEIQARVTKEDENVKSEQQREGLGREANLTWRDDLPFQNEIIEGQWWQEGEPNTVSLESQVAERMRIGLGDMLTFDIGGEIVKVKVTSIREVNWQTMQPNFFMILNPRALKDFSPTYISSFNLPKERKSELNQLIRPFPTVSLIDVDARIDQIREIIEQVSAAIEFILVLVLIAGSLVLWAQVQSSLDDRQQELAILRTLGAKGSFIRQSIIWEFVIVGSVAGFMAALANEFSLYMLQTEIFDMEYGLHLTYWFTAPVTGALVVSLLGAAACWKLLRINNMKLLRSVM